MHCQPHHVASLAVVLALAGCGDTATLPVETGYGPAPVLPEPTRSMIPTAR